MKITTSKVETVPVEVQVRGDIEIIKGKKIKDRNTYADGHTPLSFNMDEFCTLDLDIEQFDGWLGHHWDQDFRVNSPLEEIEFFEAVVTSVSSLRSKVKMKFEDGQTCTSYINTDIDYRKDPPKKIVVTITPKEPSDEF